VRALDEKDAGKGFVITRLLDANSFQRLRVPDQEKIAAIAAQIARFLNGQVE